MKRLLQYIIHLFFLIYSLSTYSQGTESVFHSGLTFVAHTKNQNERTGLELCAEKPMTFSADGFSLEFELKLRKELHTYGYVCRIVANDSYSVDVISHLLESEFKFILSDANKVLATSQLQDTLEVIEDKWIKIKLDLDKEHITFRVNNYSKEIKHSFTNFKNIKIYFGANKHPHFFTSDVPAMSLKNITIKNNQGKELYKWNLSKHHINETYDEINGTRAIVENPIWEIDRHTQWHKVKSLSFASIGSNKDPLPQIAHDEIDGKLFVVTINRIYKYHITEDKVDTIMPLRGYPYSRVGSSSQLVYDRTKNQLISYNPSLSELNFYDFDKNEWTKREIIEIDTYQHHNKFIDTRNNRLVVFGGYGIHQYNARVAQKSLDDEEGWMVRSFDSIIEPRYLSAMYNIDNQNVLILGGYGSASGKQEEFPRNYYDLHKINIDSGEGTLLWSHVNDKAHYAFGNSMILDANNEKLYTLVYNNDRYYSSIYLSSFNLHDTAPQMSVLSDSIKYYFLDIKSYCDLFLHRSTSTLYAIVQQESTPGETTTIDVYSLAFPPLSSNFIRSSERGATSNSWLYYILIFLALVLIVASLILIIRRSHKKKGETPLMKIEPSDKGIDIAVEKVKVCKSTINLLGGFRVYDKDGNNITNEFSPTAQNILIFLLLNSIKNEKGITSKKLDETFWFGMDKDSAANNRRVNISKLRILLQPVGNIVIANKNSYWTIELGENLKCDYSNLKLLLDAAKGKSHLELQQVETIATLASSGALLPNVEEEWLDEYKADFSVNLVDILLVEMKHLSIEHNARLLLKLADIILLHDSIDEDAIQMKCKVLYATKQKGLSKQSYDNFSIEYIRLLNTKPDFTYDDIIRELMNN